MQPLFQNKQEAVNKAAAQVLIAQFLRNYRDRQIEKENQRAEDKEIRDLKRADRANRARIDKEEYKMNQLKREQENLDNTLSDDVIEYTYKPGDTFGQVILDLGLNTDNGLWGSNGDVEYYSQQLLNQGIWPNGVRSNIPIGTTIRLKRRPNTN